MILRLYILLLAFVVGAVHSIYDPAESGIKTKTYRRDPQIAQALQQQQQQFTANQYPHAVDYQQLINSINNKESERLSSAKYNHNKLHQHQPQPTPSNSHQQEIRKFHEHHVTAAPTRMKRSNWDDAENAITDYYTGCPPQFTGVLPYTYDCRRFLNCWHGRGHIQTCAPGTVFHPNTRECDRPDKVVCGAVGSQQPQRSRPRNANYRAGRLQDAPLNCPSGVLGLHPHPTDCTKFLNCANDIAYVQDCGHGTAYSIELMACDYKNKVDCSGRGGGSTVDSGFESRRASFARSDSYTQMVLHNAA